MEGVPVYESGYPKTSILEFIVGCVSFIPLEQVFELSL